MSDYDQFKINLLNAAQAQECFSSQTHRPSSNCWRIRNGREMAFVHEAKEFHKFLMSCKNRPIIPASDVFKRILEKDDNDYQKIIRQVRENEQNAAEKATDSVKLLQDMLKCEDKADTSSCPEWTGWAEWSQCSCGKDIQIRKRNRCSVNSSDVDLDICKADMSADMPEDKTFQERVCTTYKRCKTDRQDREMQTFEDKATDEAKRRAIQAQFKQEQIEQAERKRQQQEALERQHKLNQELIRENAKATASRSCSGWGCIG